MLADTFVPQKEILRLAIIGADSYRDDLWVLMRPNEYNSRKPSSKQMKSYQESYDYLTSQMEWMGQQIKMIEKEEKMAIA